MSSPMKLTSSASFSPSIRISLRLRIHQAQAKNFCRVLDIRVAQIVKADTLHLVCDQKIREMLAQEIGPNPFSHRVYIDIVKIIGAIAFAADLPILLLLLFHFIEHLLTGRDQGEASGSSTLFLSYLVRFLLAFR